VGVHDVRAVRAPIRSKDVGERGPAVTVRTVMPGRTVTVSGVCSSARRVQTVTSCPAAASAVPSSRTWTFCPPASTPPTAASGLACSDTMAIRTGVTSYSRGPAATG